MDNLISIKTLSKTWEIPQNTIRWWIATGQIDYVKMGPHKRSPIRFNIDKLDRYVITHTIKALDKVS